MTFFIKCSNSFTNEISKVGSTYQIWFRSGDPSLQIECIGHQKQSEVHLQNELRTKKLYLETPNAMKLLI